MVCYLDNDSMFNLSEEKLSKIDSFIEENRREVPFYYEGEECELLYAPVEDGELRVFHHIPKNNEAKRPIVFFLGFGNPPWTWRYFGMPSHNKGEYYIIDTREKRSSKMNKHRKINMTIDQMAKDIGQVIKFLGLENQDYILMSASWGGGVLLQGLIKKYYNPGTAIALDPFPKFVQHRFFVKIFFGLTPGFVLDIIKMLLAKIVLTNMKNETQRERNFATVNEGVGWKWRRTLIQNTNFNIYPQLHTIDNEVFLFHGPKDRYHPREIYYKISSMIPKCRFFFMDSEEEKRELMAGAIAKEFAKITKNDKVPKIFEQYEIAIKRNSRE